MHDLLGLSESSPRFAKCYANLWSAAGEAAGAYVREVREGLFPGPEHCYGGKERRDGGCEPPR
jgi:3-methyl-2-oxobutanoate hydroxymethyltransferase